MNRAHLLGSTYLGLTLNKAVGRQDTTIELVLVCLFEVHLAIGVAVADFCDRVAGLDDDSPGGF